MKRLIKILAITLIALSFTSCMSLFDFTEPEPVPTIYGTWVLEQNTNDYVAEINADGTMYFKSLGKDGTVYQNRPYTIQYDGVDTLSIGNGKNATNLTWSVYKIDLTVDTLSPTHKSGNIIPGFFSTFIKK